MDNMSFNAFISFFFIKKPEFPEKTAYLPYIIAQFPQKSIYMTHIIDILYNIVLGALSSCGNRTEKW